MSIERHPHSPLLAFCPIWRQNGDNILTVLRKADRQLTHLEAEYPLSTQISPNEQPALDDLWICLSGCTHRHLQIVARQHGLPCAGRLTKAVLKQSIYAHLSNKELMHSIITQLSPTANAALRALFQAEEPPTAFAFAAVHGEIRPYTPWRKEAKEAPPLWQHPTSPAEVLWYLGLIYLHPKRPKPGVVQRVILTAAVRTVLAGRWGEPWTLPWQTSLVPATQPADLCWHLAIWLASLEHQPVAPLRGGWLPPKLLAALAERLTLVDHRRFRLSRSERRMPYLAFLHYLGEISGLAHTGTSAHIPSAHITPSGWQWLAQAPAQRWRTLWQGWRDAEDGADAAYRFPWGALRQQARHDLLQSLAKLPVGQFVPLDQITEGMLLQDRHSLLGEDKERARAEIAALLIQPCQWFGLLEIAASNHPQIAVNRCLSARATGNASSAAGRRGQPSGWSKLLAAAYSTRCLAAECGRLGCALFSTTHSLHHPHTHRRCPALL